MNASCAAQVLWGGVGNGKTNEGEKVWREQWLFILSGSVVSVGPGDRRSNAGQAASFPFPLPALATFLPQQTIFPRFHFPTISGKLIT